MVFAIPRFAEFFEEFDAELPLPTRMLMAVADFVGSPAGLITGVVARRSGDRGWCCTSARRAAGATCTRSC